MTQTTTMRCEQLRRMCNADTDERQMATNAQKDWLIHLIQWDLMERKTTTITTTTTTSIFKLPTTTTLDEEMWPQTGRRTDRQTRGIHRCPPQSSVERCSNDYDHKQDISTTSAFNRFKWISSKGSQVNDTPKQWPKTRDIEQRVWRANNWKTRERYPLLEPCKLEISSTMWPCDMKASQAPFL